ncbi:MAG: outer membrane lipoprotein-sorting protein [Flavobacteriales bacterium]|nr:outer membrane lipoprotein-sorting protein [Flavobacteriales bacterium]
MKKILVYLFFAGIHVGHASAQEKLTAKEIIQKSDQIMKGIETTKASLIIKTVRPKWTKEMQLKTWAKGTELSMILVTSPVKDKGTVFLMKDKEVWNWMPSIERIIKMPPSMMMQNWMGTDFTNDDLVKESSIVEDYHQKVIGEKMVNGQLCYQIELIPKEDAAVVWGKIVSYIDKVNFFQLKAEFYDEDEELVNLMEASDIKVLGGRKLPSKLEMIPVDKEGHKTVMIYTDITFNEPIQAGFFSTQNMKKLK